jgi:predicted metalloprotease with PDZ domain
MPSLKEGERTGQVCPRAEPVLRLRGFFGGISMNKRSLRAPFVALCLLIFCAASVQAQAANKPIHIAVDLRDATKYIFHATLEFPVKEGALTLVYPKWIPGDHAPTGPIQDLTGLKFRAGGRDIPWMRDDVDMYAFHCDVPAGAETLEVSLDYLSPNTAQSAWENSAATPQLAVLNWFLVMLYPQGAKSDDLTYEARLRLPAGWKYGTALPVAKDSGGEIEFQAASLTTLMDSPVIAGAYLRTIELSKGAQPEHRIHIAADSAAGNEATPEQVQHLRQLVAETGALFGARHYRRYDFLLSLTDYMHTDGVEHHESSDNRAGERMLLDPLVFETQMDLLPHEFFHSWNGKYRRPAGLATPDYQAPMKGDLLWVYEGLTEYYGTMLAARSGFWTPEALREILATQAAYLNERPGRSWRNLQDTAIAAQLLYGARQAGSSWRRGVDYYEESTLIWLEADTIIRGKTQGKKSLDDFCKKFHGGQNTPPKVAPYTFEDVVAAMQEIAPHDWRTFFTERLNTHGPGAPLGGLENSGWRLVFSEMMNEHQRAEEAVGRDTDVQFSLGMIVHDPGGENSDEVGDVIAGSLAAQAGIAPGMKLAAVNGRRWTPEILREAIRRAKGGSEPIELLMENEEYFRSYRIDYHGGERYPHLERNGKPDLLSDIAKMKAPAVPATKD